MPSALQLTIRLHPNDDVVIARVQLIGGTLLQNEGVTVKGMVPPGHKVAIHSIPAGAPVRRYNQIIGFASRAIAAGEHVHVNNLAMGETFARDYAFGEDVRPVVAAFPQATFMDIKRADGRVATRNYIGLLSTVNCSATVCKLIADHFRGDALKDFPNVDGVVAITHSVGCGMDVHGEGMLLLRRTLAGYARHVNFHSVLVIGLGCEANQISAFKAAEGLDDGPKLHSFNMQDVGGTGKAVAKGISLIKSTLDDANKVTRESVPAAQAVDKHGFVYMDTPGYDPVSATGQVAGGANLISFTTGRGSAYGCKPAPSLKLSTNNALWARQEEDIDINCGDIVDSGVSIEEKGREIFALILATASGQASKSERWGYGADEYVPWYIGAVM